MGVPQRRMRRDEAYGRPYTKETGETPTRAVEAMRGGRIRLRDGSEPIAIVACAIGFSDAERMRWVFMRSFGHPPQTQR